MNEETIKEILSKDLQKISIENFNEKIIQQLQVSKPKEKLTLFNQKSIITTFLVMSFFVVATYLNLFKKFTLTDYVIGLLACMYPLLYIVYNKIHRSSFPKHQDNETRI